MKKKFIILLGLWLFISSAFVTIFLWSNIITRATIEMAWGLVLLWIVLAGGSMYKFRDRIKVFIQKISLHWQIKFVLFATLLILIEEAITTLMTNLGPVFGVKLGQAYITASANYFDVIFFHSVIIIAPMFIGWAVILYFYDFSPFAVFLLFGITGHIAESTFSGSWGNFALWIFVYGLMVYLPAYSIPKRERAKKPKWWQYPLAIFFPFLFIPLTAWLPHLVDPKHPKIDFIKNIVKS
jgi:hypothetical protein